MKRSFGDYSAAWLAGRTDLRPKTAELYDYLHRVYLLPHLAHVKLGEIEPATVRWWHGRVSEGEQSPVTTAKAYRLLRQILAVAVADSILRRPPPAGDVDVEQTRTTSPELGPRSQCSKTSSC